MTEEQKVAVQNVKVSTGENEVSNEEMVKALVEYGNTRYPKIDCERTKGKAGISFKEFIESLAYTTQK